MYAEFLVYQLEKHELFRTVRIIHITFLSRRNSCSLKNWL